MKTPKPVRSTQNPGSSSQGFTLMETLVCVAVIGILAAFLLPGVNSAIVKANATKCSANLRQWGIAYLSYAQENNGALPNSLPKGEPNWQEAIAPYLVESGNSGSQRFILRAKYGCPSDIQAKDWVFAGNCYLNAVLYSKAPSRLLSLGNLSAFLVAADGVDNFWDVASYNGAAGIQYRHGRGPQTNKNYANGTANFLFADGHVQTLSAAESRRLVDAGQVVVLPP